DPQQQRRLQHRCRLGDPPPGPGRITGVQVNIKVAIIKIEMLYMKSLMRPLSQRLASEPARTLDVILTQPGDGPDKRPGRGHHVAVAALARLLEEDLAARVELGQASQVEQRPEAEDSGGVQLPDDARTPLAED